jgi:hypothetical protein
MIQQEREDRVIRERVVKNEENEEDLRRFALEEDPDRTNYRDII